MSKKGRLWREAKGDIKKGKLHNGFPVAGKKGGAAGDWDRESEKREKRHRGGGQ